MRVLTTAFACVLTTWALTAQQPTATPREVRAPDGSRFLLLPRDGPPIVHWVVASPGGTAEDPAGLEGLSAALVRASLAGTSIASSLDADAERKALSLLEFAERGFDLAAARNLSLPESAATQLADARAKAAALFDPTHWRARLRAVPALGPALYETDAGSLLAITTASDGIAAVGALLVERREAQLIRGLHPAFRQVRAELDAARGRVAGGDVRREILGLAYTTHRLARARAIPQQADPLQFTQALRQWVRTQHPTRTLHVLVGGFDPDRAAAALQATFDSTKMLAIDVSTAAPPPPASGERRASLPAGPTEIVGLGYFVPASVRDEVVETLVEWLGADAGGLPAALREVGRPGAAVRVRGPFPDRRGHLLLIEVEDPTASEGQLLRDVDAALALVIERPCGEDEVTAAVAHARSRRVAGEVGAPDLARRVALECGLLGRPVADVLRAPAPVKAEQVGRLATRVLQNRRRVIVTRPRASR